MNQYIPIYLEKLNLQGAEFSLIDHEDAMVAVVYKIIPKTGAPLILKISTRPNDYFREVYFLNHLAGQIFVPAIIKTVPPGDGLHGAILMEYLPGHLLRPAEFNDALAYEVGSQLARLHLNRVSGYGDVLQQELSKDPRSYFTMKFEEGLDECKDHLPKKLLEDCKSYFDHQIDLLLSVDGPCIVHRDFRPGNIMVEEGKLQGIIDWAGARASFAEEDFCSMEHGEWTIPLSAKQAFMTGYASIRPIPNYKALMPLLRLSKTIATLGFTVKRGTWDNSAARVYQFNRDYLDSQFTQE